MTLLKFLSKILLIFSVVIISLFTFKLFGDKFITIRNVETELETNPEDEFRASKIMLKSSKNLNYRYCIKEATNSQIPKNSWIIRPKSCDAKTTVVLLIKSSILRNDLRQSLRQTWAQELTDPQIGRVQRIFVVGTPSPSSKIALIEKENEVNNDILQVPFEDTFRNITPKIIIGMKFIKIHCPKAKLIIMADDDALIMPWNLFSHMKFNHKNTTALDWFYGGFVFYNVKLSGFKNDKVRHYFTDDEFNCTTFPPYALGNCLVLSYKVMVHLYNMAHSLRFLFADDILLATLASISDITLTDFSLSRVSWSPGSVLEPHSRPDLSNLIAFHGAEYGEQQIRVWREMCYSKTYDDEVARLLLSYCSTLFHQ